MSDETKKFEQLLKDQPLRQVPSEWRNEILVIASQAQPAHRTQPATRRSFRSVLHSLLWPHPVAWAGLAAVWILIVALNFSNRDHLPAMAQKATLPSPEMIAELRQQQRLYAELIGANDSPAADRPRIFVPKPRSECLDILSA